MVGTYRDAAYTSEKLSYLIRHLASSEETLRYRFRDADRYVEHAIEIDDFPDEHRGDVAFILYAIKEWEAMSISDLKLAVDKILGLDTEVTYHLEDTRTAMTQKENRG
jgi:hypothetical protein